MLDRRHVLAIATATLLLAGAVIIPMRAPEEMLEATAAVTGPIATAIDEGAQPSLIGLLPTSEAYKRATSVIDGLKSGIPSPAPILNAAQLNDVEAIAAGAVQGALRDPTALTAADERAKLAAFAKGYLSGALAQIAKTPSAGRAAVDGAVAEGMFTGLADLILGPEPIISTLDLEAYASALVSESFGELNTHAQLLANVAGSPAITDITLYTTDLATGQIDSMPVGIVRSQLDAIAYFGAGAVDGIVIGLMTGFPEGVPAPEEQAIREWIRQIAVGHPGTPPWNSPGSLPLLLAWADASTAAAIASVEAVHDNVTGFQPISAIDEVGAWAMGVARTAYSEIDKLASYTPEIERDVREYAEAATAPGLTYILEDPHPALDLEAVTAFAEGLGGAVESFGGASLDALGLTEDYLAALSSSVTDLPTDASPVQSEALEAFLEGATNRLTVRMEAIATAIGGDEAAFLVSMATGMAEGAVGIATGPSLSRPDIARALGDGLATGFLESRNPRVLVEDAIALKDAAKTWIGSNPPVSITGINDVVLSSVRDPYNAIRDYGRTMGHAPISWAEGKSRGIVNASVWDGLDDILWLHEFTNASVPLILQEIKDGMMHPDPQITIDAVTGYAGSVTGNLSSLNISTAIDNLTSDEYGEHASDFAEFILTPLDWGVDKPRMEAALEVLNATISNATNVERFSDPDYARAALAFIEAVGKGLKEGQPGDGGYVEEWQSHAPAWVGGVTNAILAVPTNAVTGDISSRVLWLTETTEAAQRVAKNASISQFEATWKFAAQSARWALGAPGRVPPAGTLPTPLVTWANTTITGTIERLPPVMTKEESEAVVAYATGIQRAITALPPIENPLDWGPIEPAFEAYVGGIVSGVSLIPNETLLYLCSYNVNVSGCPPKPPEPPCDCNGSGSDREPGAFEQYLKNIGVWTETLTRAIDDMNRPDTDPTVAGVELVARWSTEVLAGHGFCPDAQAQTFECDGPRGPLWEFAQARNDSVAAFADAISQGYGHFIDRDDPPEGFVYPIVDPLLFWAQGIQNAASAGYLHPERLIEPSNEDPAERDPILGAPPTDPNDPAFKEKLRAWTDSLFTAPGRAYDAAWVEFPDTQAWNQTVAEIDYVFAHVIWEGGFDAINQSDRNLSAFVLNATPNASLDALAIGLVNATKDILVDPAAKDLQSLLAWYHGLAEGGVEAILDGAEIIRAEQVPAIAAYAEYVATTYAPPTPPAQDILEEEVLLVVFPPDEKEDEDNSTGGGGGEEPDPPSAEEVYLQNVQAHAEGIAEAILDTPLNPFIADAQAYGGLYLSYVSAIANATKAIPPVSPDSGFPARLSAWAKAEADAALAAPPTSPDRLGPDPNATYAIAFIESFAGTSPWSLVPMVTEKVSWAYAAITGGIDSGCPIASEEQCAIAGRIVGDALGTSLPQELPTISVTPPAATPTEQIALLTGLIKGATAGLDDVEPGPAPTGMVEGLVAALVPEGAKNPDAGKIAEAVAVALGPALDDLPPAAAEPAAREIAATLLTADPAQYKALANGAVALLVATASTGADAAALQQSLGSYLDPEGSSAPTIVVGDGSRSYSNEQLTSSASLDGQRDIIVSVHPSASAAPQTSWEIVWSATDPNAAGASRKALAVEGGVYRGTFAPSELANLPRAATVRFLVVETSPTGTLKHGPYTFLPDRDAPTASVSAPEAPNGASFLVTWSGADGDTKVTSFRVETRDGGGAWKEWLRATSDTSASFTGVPGHRYAIRVTPTDAVGHVGAASADATATIPSNAVNNRAPTVSITAPLANAVFGRSVAVVLVAADPDGTQPSVRVCVRKAGSSVDLSCPHEGKATTFSLDTRKLSDGRYQLHATATDGTLSAQTDSGAFTIDRSPPAFRGANADADAERVILSAALDDATRVLVDVDGRTIALTEGSPGVWTGTTNLAPGKYTIAFRATDANGNEASERRVITVPLPAPPPGSTSSPPTTPSEPESEPAPTPATPDDQGGSGVPGAPLALALVALAAIALARRRR